MSESFLERAAKWYRSETHQKAAWRGLEATLDPNTLEIFKRAYRGSQVPQKKTEANHPHTPYSVTANWARTLDVPYYYQRDSKTGQGERMCFSSSMVMALDFLQPDLVEGDDDWYLQIVQRFGDSVDSHAQVQAARYLGFECEFRTDGTKRDIEVLLETGYPVPIGVLHKGHYIYPEGGGHWITLIGHEDDHFIVHDPFGRMDLVNGGYPHAGPTDGKERKYGKDLLMSRWLIANDHDGWFMDLSNN